MIARVWFWSPRGGGGGGGGGERVVDGPILDLPLNKSAFNTDVVCSF